MMVQTDEQRRDEREALRLNAEVKETYRELFHISQIVNARIAELGEERNEYLGRILGEDPTHLTIGSWGCPTSPIKVCVYDAASHMGNEECLICGEPSERK